MAKKTTSVDLAEYAGLATTGGTQGSDLLELVDSLPAMNECVLAVLESNQKLDIPPRNKWL